MKVPTGTKGNNCTTIERVDQTAGLDYEVQYKKGIENRVADALSRSLEEEPTLYAISAVEPTWMNKIEMSYEHDHAALQLIIELVTNPGAKPKLTLTPGVIRFEDKIYVGR